ncbi:MAG: type II secretion system F family protein [Atopobiaceae bacterium]|jgi:tight adherence protein B|nr:type II secretion system F family protein [Atopobiaceae bacterium]MCI2174223.1 type II secretion system F family protein [Atopobiaceae bacterium]MCI2206864.1 type II secretion system F family protein [Atopobiaceae bacterium]
MEVMLLVSAAAAAVSVLLVLPSETSEVARGVRAHARMARALAVVDAVSRTTVADMLLSLPSWDEACSILVEEGSRQGRVVTRRQVAVLLVLSLAGLCLVAGILAASPLGVVVGAVAASVAIPSWVAMRRKRRQTSLAREMPGVFRSLASALGAGQTLSQAIGYVGSRGEGVTGEEFRRAAMRLRCGSSTTEVVSELTERLDAPGMGLMGVALKVSQRTGSPLGSLFDRAARLVERQGEAEQVLVVKTAQVRLSARIVSAMPAVMVALLAMMSPDFQRGLSSPVGIASVCVAALLDIVALAIIRRLMREVA